MSILEFQKIIDSLDKSGKKVCSYKIVFAENQKNKEKRIVSYKIAFE